MQNFSRRVLYQFQVCLENRSWEGVDWICVAQDRD
jgi:hypothetical protein